MDELLRKCMEDSERKHYPGVIETASKILAEAISEVISGQAVQRDYEEIVQAVADVINSANSSRYKNTEYSEAFALLGKIFETGVLTERNLKKAFLYYTKAAENSNPFGCYRLAHFYEHGIACSRHKHKAAHFYKLSANGGCSRGAHRYGMMLLEGGGWCHQDIKGGVFYLEQARKLATVQYPHAIYDLALCYEEIPLVRGHIIADLDYALKLYLEGEKLGCIRSTVRLGNAYHYGELGVAPSIETAISYYQRAESTSGEACFELYQIAKQSGDNSGLLWLKKAAERGHPISIKLYARKLELGDGITQDRRLALWWYRIGKTRGVDTASDIKRCSQ